MMNPTDPRWQAVLARDRAAAGDFFYSVRTTGVYCRPSCAARTPRRENVQFHATARDAEAAGFRPCKRCRPDAVAGPHAERIAAACRAIAQAEEPLPVDELAARSGMSVSHFHRTFRKLTGLTPRAYAAAHRASRLRQALSQPGAVTQAIYEAGYNSSGRFYEEARAVLGMTPSAFRDGGQAQSIRFAVGECSLGAILVAATGTGVCAIFLGDDPDALARQLQDRFPRAEFKGGDAAFEQTVARAVAMIEAPGAGASLPLDIRGTAFKRRVWQALQQIPVGQTASYAEVARAIGAPDAARAVAAACAANQIAVAIPCHRVVRTGGALSGYRWGVERKQALLDREKSGTAHGDAAV